MKIPFTLHATAWLSAGSLLLSAGLFAAVSGQRAQQQLQAQQATLRTAESRLLALRDRIDNYNTLIERIGWRPGLMLRHENIDTSTTIAGNEAGRLNEILQANYGSGGHFFLQSLRIEPVRANRAGIEAGALKVAVKGDNILLLDRP